MKLRIDVGLAGHRPLGGDGFNAWLVIVPEAGDCVEVEHHEFPLLHKNTTFDEAKERALVLARTRIQVWHSFSKDGFELIDS